MTRTLLRWASAGRRRWAIEGSDGLGRLLARQLVLPARRSWTSRPPSRRRSPAGTGPASRAASPRAASRGMRQVAATGRPRCCGCWPTAVMNCPSSAARRSTGSLRDLVPGVHRLADRRRRRLRFVTLRPRDPVAIERAAARSSPRSAGSTSRTSGSAPASLRDALTDAFGISYVPGRQDPRAHRPHRTVRHCRRASRSPAQPRSYPAEPFTGCRVRQPLNTALRWPTCSACTQAPGKASRGDESQGGALPATSSQGHQPPAPVADAPNTPNTPSSRPPFDALGPRKADVAASSGGAAFRRPRSGVARDVR